MDAITPRRGSVRLARVSLRAPAWLARSLPAVAVAAAVVILGLPTLIMPLHPDQATFALVGQTVARGGFPYVDALDQKPPALYLLYAIAVQGPFDVMRDVRVFDIGWSALTAALLVCLGRRWWGVRAGVFAGLLYGVIWATGNPWWQGGQPDSFIALPLVAALLAYERGRFRARWLITTGVLLGFAFQLRYTVALFIPLFPLADLAEWHGGARWRRWLQHMIWLGIGFAGVQILLVLYLAAGHAIHEYLDVMRYSAGYTRLGGPYNSANGPTPGAYLTALRLAFWNWGAPRMALLLPAAVGAFAGSFVERDRRVVQVTLFAVLTYAGIALQAKFFTYHFASMVPTLALLGGWAWDRALALLRRSYRPLVAAGVAALPAALLLLGSSEVWDNGWNYWKGYLHYRDAPERDIYYYFFAPGFLSVREVSDYIEARTRPEEPIYVWGYDPLVYLLADRPSASRFLYAFPLMSDWAPARWQTEFLSELEKQPPAYIVVERGDVPNWIVDDAKELETSFRRIPGLERWLAANYEQETELAGALIYRRRW